MLAQQQKQRQQQDDKDGDSVVGSRFGKILLFDRLSPPPNPDDDQMWIDNVSKFYLIGLGGRGQRALRHYEVWDNDVLPRCTAVLGRKDWVPGSSTKQKTTSPAAEPVVRLFGKERATTTQVLPREKLVGILHQVIQKNYSHQITLCYGVEVQPVQFHNSHAKNTRGGGGPALVRIAKCTNDDSLVRNNPSAVSQSTTTTYSDDVTCDTDISYVSTPLLIAADGTVRTMANAIANLDQERLSEIQNPLVRFVKSKSAFRVKRYPDDNQRIYKTIPMKLPKDWRSDLNYSARTGRVNFDALPANNQGDYCGVLLLKGDDPMAKANTDPVALRAMLDDALPQFSALLDDTAVTAVAAKPVSYLPTFRYAGPRLHEGDATVLLGDCAHTVKPYFGLGANSALEDVLILEEALKAYPTDIARAVESYSSRRAPESRTLVRISRDLDRPGKLGFLFFVVPIILDAVFAKACPKLFMPNVITMLQKESYTFQKLARRKRFDRALQLIIIAGVFASLGGAIRLLVQALGRVTGFRLATVWAAASASRL